MRSSFTTPVKAPTIAASLASHATTSATWTNPVGLVYIQNESLEDLFVQLATSTYDNSAPAHVIVKGGETRSIEAFIKELTIYNSGTSTVYFEPTGAGNYDEDVLIWALE